MAAGHARGPGRNIAIRALEGIVVFCMASMVVLVFGNVVLRYGFNSGISISEEMSRMLFVWMTFVGAVIAVAESTHLGMDSVVQKLSRQGVIVCAVVGDVLIVICCFFLGEGAWTQTVVNMGNVAAVSGIPLGIVHASVLVASIGIILIVSGRCWRILTGRPRPTDLVLVGDAEEKAASEIGGTK